MKRIKSVVGYTLAGLIVMSVWGEIGQVGILGGFVAAIIIIGPLWFLNHYLNLTSNEEGVAFVDMGLAIGICGIARDSFIHGSQQLVAALPTISLVVIGAVVGGILSAKIENYQKAEEEQK